MDGSEAINDYSCVRERISFSDRAEDLVRFKCSVFFLFVHLGVSNLDTINKEECAVFYFRSPLMKRNFSQEKLTEN